MSYPPRTTLEDNDIDILTKSTCRKDSDLLDIAS